MLVFWHRKYFARKTTMKQLIITIKLSLYSFFIRDKKYNSSRS